MKAKKGKELINELISDLLGDDKTVPIAQPQPTSSELNLSPPTHADETVRVGESKIFPADFPQSKSQSALSFDKNVRTSVGKFAVKPTAGGAGHSSDAALMQAENLRIAQQKIFELEEEIERLRRENEQLAAAGETIRRRADDLSVDNELKTRRLEELRERVTSEKELLETSLRAKDRELKDLKLKVEEYEMRLSTNLQKIRVRERELENRLELVKMEGSALVRNKDEMLLDMKRQIDQLKMELENYRTKGQELSGKLGEQQETLRRTVKALRLALNLLEGGDDSDGGNKNRAS